MRRTFLLAMGAAVLSASTAASERAAVATPATSEAVVIAAVENMYSAPDLEKDVVTQALLGQTVTVLETRGGFAQVETPDRYRGWLPVSALRVYGPAEARYASAGPVAEVTSLVAHLYRDPSVTTARPVTDAPLGTRLAVIEPAASTDKPWAAVRLPDGRRVFLHAADARFVDAAAPRPRGTGADVLATARRFTGVPYTWGGMSPRGVDCSGLASRSYFVNGVQLLRDADLQFDDPALAPVERAELQVGDLVFFGEKKITHVGIYAGQGTFISATASHGAPTVHEDPLDDPHWGPRYRGARRPR